MTERSDIQEVEQDVANREVREQLDRDYEWGFVTDIDQEQFPPGLSEDVIRALSAKKEEPEWLLEWRLEAYRKWLTMTEPTWAMVDYDPIDYNDIVYYSAPKSQADGPKSLDEVDPELLETYEKLGIPLEEQKLLAGVVGAEQELSGVAVDAVFDSVSVATTFKAELEQTRGDLLPLLAKPCTKHPELVQKYLGSRGSGQNDNFYRGAELRGLYAMALSSTSPKGVRCPMELSTYFRINAQEVPGQFERTLIIADEGQAYVSYLEGCTAPEAR